MAISALEKGIDRRIGLRVGTVIDEFFNGNSSGKFGETANVISMIVRRDQMIDGGDSRVLRGCDDPFGVAYRAGAAVSGIDEHRFSRRRDKQDRIAAFNIDYILTERFSCLSTCDLCS